MGDGTAKRRKIAILGGGIGACTAAYYLTSKPGWEQEYEVTLYQLGWRLGGKGATGRQGESKRILEHGLHVWFGWYENAFRTLRRAYADLDRAPGQKIANVDEAFTARQDVQMLENHKGQWLPWNMDFPVREGVPGESAVEPFLWDVIIEVLDVIEQWLHGLHRAAPDAGKPHHGGILSDLLGKLEEVPQHLAEATFEGALDLVQALASHARPDRDERGRALVAPHHDLMHSAIAKGLRAVLHWMKERLADAVEDDTELRRLFILVDLAATGVIGCIEDGAVKNGLEVLDEWDLYEWMQRHGAAQITLDSTPMRALYDCFFGYRDGNLDERCIAAGAGLGCALRIGLTYHGSVLYIMNAGMGDVVVAPIYEVLARRGVRVEFFQRVTAIEPAADGRSVERVRIGVQATVKDGKPYQPLITVQDLPCWPNHPLYDQLDQGEEMRAQGVNIQSSWTRWKDVGARTLEAGRDFDQVVLGISLAGLGPICAPLGRVNAHWAQMLDPDKMPSMQTMGVQLWLTKSLAEMGWEGPPRPSVAMPELLDVWADMSQTIQNETYQAGHMPRGIIYLCGPLPGDALHEHPPTDHSVPAKAWAEVYAETKRWLEAYPGHIWPRSTVPGSASPALDWRNLFVERGDAEGEERLRHQFLRANIDATERYVLSPPRWNRLRLPAGASGFSNLFLAGDWTRTAVNAGCVEAATMSGMECSRAICGYPEDIAGEHFMQG